LIDAFSRHAARLLPQSVFGPLGWLRGSVGAGVAIAFAGIATSLLLDQQTELQSKQPRATQFQPMPRSMSIS